MAKIPGQDWFDRLLLVIAQNLKWILPAIALLAVILFLTNPDQTTHLKAINEAVELRLPNTPYGSSYTRMTGVIQYHDYGLFSTTGFADMISATVFLGEFRPRTRFPTLPLACFPDDRLRSPSAQRSSRL
jgi:hypothetical protein